MAFEKVEPGRMESICPNSHPLHPIASLGAGFCVVCGAKLIERQKEPGTICGNCHNPVNENWLYCPWCGSSR